MASYSNPSFEKYCDDDFFIVEENLTINNENSNRPSDTVTETDNKENTNEIQTDDNFKSSNKKRRRFSFPIMNSMKVLRRASHGNAGYVGKIEEYANPHHGTTFKNENLDDLNMSNKNHNGHQRIKDEKPGNSKEEGKKGFLKRIKNTKADNENKKEQDNKRSIDGKTQETANDLVDLDGESVYDADKLTLLDLATSYEKKMKI